MAAIGLQQLQHALVGGPFLARQGEGHHVRVVVVADRHRVGVAVADADHLGRRPGADAGQGSQPGRGLARGHARALLDPAGIGGGPAQDLGAPPLQPEAVEDLVGRARKPIGRGRHAESRCRAGGRVAERAHQTRIGVTGFGARNLLLDDRSGQGFHDRPAAGEAQSRQPAGQLSEQLVPVVPIALLPAPAQAADWSINSFESQIAIAADGSLKVTEDIEVTFAGPHHGIYRDIPVVYEYDEKNNRVLQINVDSVRGPGRYSTSRKGADEEIKIGDPDRTLTGRQSYLITYTVRGAFNGFPDHDELYWNVTGNQWGVP